MAAAAKKKVETVVLDPEPMSVLDSENAPKYQVVDQVFVWKDEEQGVLRVPLRFKFKILRELVRLEKEEGASPSEQMICLLDAINDEKTKAQLDEMWLDDATELVSAYFEEFGNLNNATPGE